MQAPEIIIVVLTLLICLSIVWSTILYGITPTPSSKKACEAILQLVHETGAGPVFDLGSGWGNLVIPMAKKFPQRKIVAYEMSLIPWLVTKFFKLVLGLNNLEIHRENFLKANLSTAAVLVCYLYPGGMNAISKKLSSEKNFSGFLISHCFALPSLEPEKTIRLNDLYRSPIYLYHIGE